MTDEPRNGYVRWPDLNLHAERESVAHTVIHARIDPLAMTQALISQDVGNLMSVRNNHELRINSIESVLDQQRGARALVVLLIGSNLLAAVAMVLGLYR